LHACRPTLMSVFVNKKRRSNMKKESKEVKELKKEVKGVEKMDKGVEKMDKGVEKMKEKGVEKMKEKGVKEMKEKGVKEMIDMKKESKELIKEIEAKKEMLVKKVVEWAENLKPVKDVHIKIKGRYYPLLEKETGKLYLIDRVQGKKVPFDTLEDQNMKFVISAVLAERKEQIEKEVKEDKRKYLEGKLKEVDELLNKF